MGEPARDLHREPAPCPICGGVDCLRLDCVGACEWCGAPLIHEGDGHTHCAACRRAHKGDADEPA